MENKDDSKICIMIIPHTEKVKRITVSKWILKAIITSVAAIVVTVIIFFNYMSSSKLNLKEDTTIALKKYQILKKNTKIRKKN